MPTIPASVAAQQRPPKWLDAVRSVAGMLLPSVMVEPGVGWWTDNPSFGNRFTGNFPSAEDVVIPIANLDQVPGPPRVVAISFFRSPQAVSIGPAVNSDVRAEVIYGAGGVSNTLLLDATNGVNFTVVANTVRVQYRTYRPNQFLAYAPQTDVILATTLGLGPAAPGIPPTFTSPIQIAATVGPIAATFQTPEFARRVSFFGAEGPGPAPLTLTEISVAFHRPSGTVLNRFTASSVEPLFRGDGGGFPVPADCAFVSLTSTAGLDKVVGAVWQLGI